MKKIALLMVLILTFSLSCVFATDLAAPTTAPVSGEILSGEDVTPVVSGEINNEISGEDEVISGEDDIISGEDNVSGEIVDNNNNQNTNTPDITDNNNEEVPSSNNSAIIGAIIAIAIVAAAVAVAAILRKN